MESIVIAIVQLGFLALLVFGAVFIVKKSGQAKRNKPALENDSNPVLANLVNKIPGFSQEDKDLNSLSGALFTTADISQIYEQTCDSFKRYPLFTNPNYNFKEIQADQQYLRIIMRNVRQEKLTTPHGEIPTIASTTLQLNFRPIDSAGTAIEYSWTIDNPMADPWCDRIKKTANERLRSLCLKLTQDPDHNSPF